MPDVITRPWLACEEWRRLEIQAFGVARGDPVVLRALDEANENAHSINEEGDAEPSQQPSLSSGS
jgi:hypothetical protein